MGVSQVSTHELNADEMARRACQLAGYLGANQTVSGPDLEMALDFMNLELQHLQAEGFLIRAVERTTQLLTVSEDEYVLGAGIIDAIFPMTIVPAAGGGETLVEAMTRSEYLEISRKDATGRPTRCYVERPKTTSVTATTGRVRLILWPTPDTADTLRFTKVRRLYDMDVSVSSFGDTTLDLDRQWVKTITYCVAWQMALAKSLPMERVGFLRNEAEQLKRASLRNELPSGEMRAVLDHNVRRWS